MRLRCHAKIVVALLRSGADVKAADITGKTPLMILAESNCWREAPESFLISGFDEDVRSFLDNARKQQQDPALEVARALARFGADPTAKDENGHIPLDVARAGSGGARLFEFWERCLAKEAVDLMEQAMERRKLHALPHEFLQCLKSFF